MTDDEMTRVAGILRKQLRAAPPEQYRFTWELVFQIYADLDSWFGGTDVDYMPEAFHRLVFEDYPIELYG